MATRKKTTLDLGPPNRYYNGAMLPADLRESSNFPWDGDGEDVVDAINDGRFLVIHRDHAGASGWATPDFELEPYRAI